jgi:hypothetical protein
MTLKGLVRLCRIILIMTTSTPCKGSKLNTILKTGKSRNGRISAPCKLSFLKQLSPAILEL